MHIAMKFFAPLLCLILLSSPLTDATFAAEESEKTKSASQDDAKKDDAKKKDKGKDDKKDKDSEPEPTITKHTATIEGEEIAYTATAREMVMKDDKGKAKARVFFVAYTKDDVEDRGERPVTFCFNGGPGSSSVWLHLGLLGPQRVTFPEEAENVRPPQRVSDNPYSLLDKTDLVFIDPVATGYSRAAEDEKRSEFHGYQEDLRSVGRFIHDYTTEYGRWGSPKFLIGESYGGLRAAGLTGVLQDRYYMYLNGVVLVSAVVDFRTIYFSDDNHLAYALFLPSYTATAWYHEALPKRLQKLSLEEVVRRAETFAMKRYLPALQKGDALPTEERDAVVAQFARLTGLSEEYVDQADLQISMWRFGKELLRERNKIIGRFDSRFLGVDKDRVAASAGYDPSGAAFFGPFTSAINDYFYHDLKYRNEGVYEILTDKVRPWSYDGFENAYVNASETLRQAMVKNPYLKVFAACGYYDLATPHFAMEYTRDHLGLDEELKKNFSMEFYEAGHMMYVHEPSLKKLRKDLVDFYQSALEDDQGEAPAE